MAQLSSTLSMSVRQVVLVQNNLQPCANNENAYLTFSGSGRITFMFWLKTMQSEQVRLKNGQLAALHPNSGCYSTVIISGLHIVALFYALYILQDLGRAVFI